MEEVNGYFMNNNVNQNDNRTCGIWREKWSKTLVDDAK